MGLPDDASAGHGLGVGAGRDHDLAVFPPGLRGKRILLCTESFGPVNGVSRTTLMLVNHLRANGADVAVVAPHNHTKVNAFVPAPVPHGASAGPASPSPLPPANPELRIHGYPLPFNPELSIVYPVRLSSLYARTFGAAPDLIYLASPASLGFQVMFQLRQQPRDDQVPLLCNFQTDLAGYCAILFPPPLSDFAVYTFAQVEGFLFRHPSVKTMFYPSRFVRRYLEKNGVPPAKMQVLRRGVNTDLFNPARRSPDLHRRLAPDGEIVLICVARLAGEKGFEFLSRAATALDARGLAFKLYIVGGNRSPEVEADIRGLFADLERRGRVEFAGLKVGEDLSTSYASADIFLHCSITETFGLVVLESMASGVPVVARDEGGPSDIVDDGVTGYLVPPHDLDGFVAKVMLLARDRDLRACFSDAARRQACESTWDKINNKVAWGMLDAIEAREREKAEAAQPRDRRRVVALADSDVSSPAWRIWREVDKSLFAGLGIIMGFWGAVSIYLAFIKTALWVKARLRW